MSVLCCGHTCQAFMLVGGLWKGSGSKRRRDDVIMFVDYECHEMPPHSHPQVCVIKRVTKCLDRQCDTHGHHMRQCDRHSHHMPSLPPPCGRLVDCTCVDASTCLEYRLPAICQTSPRIQAASDMSFRRPTRAHSLTLVPIRWLIVVVSAFATCNTLQHTGLPKHTYSIY